MLSHAIHCALLFLAATALALAAPAVYVDNVAGDDANPGTLDAPVRTVARGVALLEPSGSLHLTPTGQPYQRLDDDPIRITQSGTADAPTVIDGHGAELTGRRRYPAAAWTSDGDGVFSMPLPNNAQLMPTHWEGFDLVYFDGKPGRNRDRREGLEPFDYFLYKNRKAMKTDPLHNVLFIRLPEGRTPADVAVETAGIGSNLSVGGSYVTVRNLTSTWACCDGFSTYSAGGRDTQAVGIRFERVVGAWNMDQGISHHGTRVTVEDSRFHHNTGGGIVDVTMWHEVRATYRRCLIDQNIFRGGVELLNGLYIMEDCVIRGNDGSALLIGQQARATLTNCLIVGRPGARNWAEVRHESAATFTRCTFANLDRALVSGNGGLGAPKTVLHCAFVACPVIYDIGLRGPAFQADYNCFTPGEFRWHNRRLDFATFQRESGLDAHSVAVPYTGAMPPWQPVGGAGADLNPETFNWNRHD